MINGVKQGGVVMAWTLIFFSGCYTGVDIICIWDVYLVLNGSTFFVLNLMRQKIGVELFVYDVWFAEDDNTSFLSVGLDIFDRLYLK